MDSSKLFIHFFLIAVIIFLFYVFIVRVISRYRSRMSRDQGIHGFVEVKKTTPEEKRQHPRLELRWPVFIETAQDKIKAETMNISVGGAFVVCPKPLAVGEEFRVEVQPPEGQAILLKAEVVWNNVNVPEDKIVTRGMGIRFVQVSAEERERLSDALPAHQK
jgi:uncharacterized protein (TIGR02266 family)